MLSRIARRGTKLARCVRVALLLLGFCLPFLAQAPVHAEGSRTLVANGGKRYLLEWRTSLYGNLLRRRTFVQVYARAGEVINLGSSAMGVGSGDIVLYRPGIINTFAESQQQPLPTATFRCATSQPTKGRLDTRAKELAGPLPSSGGYDPCTYTAQETGIHWVAFYGPDGATSDRDGDPGTIAAPNITATQNNGVSMWDVTVRASATATQDASGRVFVDYLAALTGGNGDAFRIYSTFYAVTDDGFQYAIDLRGMDPFGFIIYGNDVGFYDSDGTTPLYHDLVATTSQLTDPRGGVTLGLPTASLFINQPDPTLPPTILPIPQPPGLSNVSFQGSAGGTAAYRSIGGTFRYNGNIGGIGEVVISRDGTSFDPGNPNNRVLRSETIGGTTTLYWNGLANDGTAFPNGTYSYLIEFHAGEYHFPLLDVENSREGGPTLRLLNPPGGTCPFSSCTTAFYDDRGYRTLNGTLVGTPGVVLAGNAPPTIPFSDPTTGFNSAGTQRAFGNSTGSGFGDTKGLDLWTYFPSQAVQNSLTIVAQPTRDLSILKRHTGNFKVNDSRTYTIEVTNSGTSSITGVVTVRDTLPTGLTPTAASGSTWSCTISGQVVTCTNPGPVAAATALPPITLQVAVGQAAYPAVTNTATVSNANDTNSANNTSSDPTTVTATILSAPKTATLVTDADGNGTPSPGDTLRYSITVSNTGNEAATGVVFTDVPDANTTLVVGSVTTTAGVVVLGNTAGNPTVEVKIGNIVGGSSAIITFDVRINSPVPVGVTQVSNQGSVTSNETASVLTDNPAVAGNADPTITTITAAPLLRASKVDTLAIDADSNGVPSPGDTIEYAITLVNTGTTGATSIVFNDTPGTNLSLVVGSVTTTQGTITSGNTSGNTSVSVSVGTLAGGGASATIRFRARVASPLPTGVTQVTNQGSVSSAGSATFLTDDPDFAGSSDPTVTAVTAAPVLNASKRATLATDSDANGVPSPGDTLLYTIVINNSGNTAATNVLFTDPIDANLAIRFGSVSTSQGTITSGNGSGDRSVAVTLGQIAAGQSATITFQVLIVDPLPAGVTQVSNQGSVSSSQLPTLLTDDPATTTLRDATVTTVTAAPLLSASKRDSLLTDADSNGVPSPGDTLLYTIEIANTGNTAATNVVFADVPGANTTLVVGSVTTSQGTITSGNTAGNTSVGVSLGTVAGRSTATLSFRVTINTPLPAGVTQVTNQGSVTSSQLPTLLTNDPDTPAAADSTATSVTAAPLLSASKRDSLATDADGNGLPSPGDTLLYTIGIANTGNSAATNVVFTDLPGANTTLVVGSVQSTQGTVTSGNTAGNTSVTVSIGTLPGGSTTTLSFRVTVANPLPAGVTQVTNQGTVSSSQLPALPTDDPDTPAAADSTATAISAAPVLSASKRDSLATDADGNGVPSPGDTLLYTIGIANTGNSAATNVTFSDVPGANTTLVVGSVTTSQGTVTSGNAAGNTTVAVSLGTLPGGSSVSISFRVTINNPLPGGVSQVTNQGVVSSTQIPSQLTDDPDTLAQNDATGTAVTAVARLDASKEDTLIVDADGNGVPSPGDTLLYTIRISNSGNAAASGVTFTDTPDPNTRLVVGSVQSTQGSVTSGNGTGNTTVAVSLGTIPGGGGGATVSFRVTIVAPFPTGVSQVSNQGQVSSSQLPTVLTDDPDIGGSTNPTTTGVTSAPRLTAQKSATLLTDSNGDGVPSPGDTLLYQITITNGGNSAATNVRFTDTPDPNAPLVVGSVSSSQGSVVLGNTAGNTTVEVALGTLPAQATATLSFSVRVVSPFPEATTAVRNQGTVTSDQLAPLATDDPSTPAAADSTVTPILVGAIGGITFVDTDGDGIRDPNENALVAGVPITIRNSQGTIVAQLVSSGSYVKYDLPPGTYTVTAQTVPGYVLTSPSSVTVVLQAGQRNLQVNFGFLAPTEVPLSVFTAAWQPEGILVTWETTVEPNNDGFHLWRALGDGGAFVRLTERPIPSEAAPGGGARYEFLDPALQPDDYRYQLEFVPSGLIAGPIPVEPPAPTAVALAHVWQSHAPSPARFVLIVTFILLTPLAYFRRTTPWRNQ